MPDAQMFTPFAIQNDIENMPKVITVDSTSANGFHVCLENGYHVSVQWGMGTYSDNHDVILRAIDPQAFYAPLRSTTAEVAVINPNGTLIETPFNRGDTVIGWQKMWEVKKIIKWASELDEHDKNARGADL